MLAIPLDREDATTLSKLYVNAPYFALLDENNGAFKVIKNREKGDGKKSADFIAKIGADATIFFDIAEGIYKTLDKNGITVFSSDHKQCSIDEIYMATIDHKLLALDDDNYKSLIE